MTNNDILRRIRYIFDFSDSKMLKLFEQGGLTTDRTTISDWLKSDDLESFQQLKDKELAIFLNGLIIDRRGKQNGEQPMPEKSLNNNIIFRKLKIALSYRDEDIMEVFDLAKFIISRHELSAIFRKPSQSQYRKCKDQFLRYFLIGLQIKYHPNDSKKLNAD